MSKSSFTRRSLLLGVAIISFPAVAFGQDAQPSAAGASAGDKTVVAQAKDVGLEDIIVTARRRSESMINVPVAVTALSGADVARYSANNIDKITQLAPQVMTSKGFSGNGASFAIRGLGSGQSDAGIEQTVAINVDGVQISRGRIVTSAQFDLARVEILKGPQALFFGKNSPAGVISITTADPTDHFEGYVRTGFEFAADNKYIEGAISGPLTSTLQGRFAFHAAKSIGYLKDVALPAPDLAAGLAAYPFPGAWEGRLGGATELAGRGTLKWAPSSRFDATAKVLIGRYKSDDPYSAAQVFCAPGVVPTGLGLPDTQDDCAFNNKTAATAPPTAFVADWPGSGSKPFLDQHTLLGSLTMNYKFDNLTLTNVAGYTRLTTALFANAQGSSNAQIYAASPERAETFSNEVRLNSDFDAPVNFVIGAYYDHSKRRSEGISRIAGLAPDPATGVFYQFHRIGDVSGDTYSAFGQIRWDIVSNLELAGGARYTKENKDLNIRNTYVNPVFLNSTPNGFRAPGSPLIASQKSSNWSPEATLTWHPIENTTIYAAYKTGYKSGGFSNPGTLRNFYTSDTIQFGPERAKGGEVGFKGYLLDHTLRLELTTYSYNFKGLQLSTFDAQTITYQIKNAAEARTRGVEANIDWKISSALTVRGALGYNKARYLSFPNATCYQRQTTLGTGCNIIPGTTTLSQNLAGKPLPRAPDLSLNFGGSYDVPLGDAYMLSFSSDANYSSKYFTEDSDDPYSMQKGFWRVNGSVRFKQADDKWELALIGRNIFNQRYKAVVLDAPGDQQGLTLQSHHKRAKLHWRLQFTFERSSPTLQR
ncbi:TonB-dependent receptor (plasmid) [Sphingomonas paeninsulae]|uniref:TonB-dependent receptor n=1 Tax=Sphingomonas paeninsulae TaxID=2319844 RepID=A0A494T643_SPHPE|nr:TonB-dependent receptor [Sphingomonas paeninsulae]AYJ84869.1 TonB-dependent receptor [Sphingomonas paeninsulae]